MKSVLMMATANIRKRKAQSFLIMLTILMASLLLATAIGILGNISDPFEKMFEEQKGSHLTLQLAGDLHDPEQIVNWWQDQAGVEGVQGFPFYMTNDKIRHNTDLKSMGDLMLTEHPEQSLTQDQLVIVDGEVKEAPGKNEIWIPTSFAYSHDIAPGDVLDLPFNGGRQALTVTAIIVDPQFSIGMMNPVRTWVAPGTINQAAPESGDVGSIIGVRLTDYSHHDVLWADFEDFLGSPFLGFLYDYEFVGYSYSMVENIIGAIMLLFSAIIILVSVFVIYFTISGAIATDYKLIGILKSSGFSSAQVKRVYAFQYLVLSIIAVPLGIILSSPVTNAVLQGMTKSLGLARLNASLLLPATVSIPAMLMIVLAAALISANKAGKIKPAQAIRNAAPISNISTKKSFNLTNFKTMPVSLLLGLKNTLTGKRHSLFMVASAAIMAFVLVFSINAYNSVRGMDENLAYWGFDNAEVWISNDAMTPEDHKQVQAILSTDDRVEGAVPQGVLLTAIAAQAEQTSQNVVGFAYNGDMDSIGMLNLKGKHPARANEVSLSVLTAQKYNKSLGDMVDLYIEGQKGSYLVTGIYQSLNGGGWGFRIQEAAVQAVNPDFRTSNYSVKLDNGTDPILFVEDMKLVLGQDYNTRTAAESGEINFTSIAQSMAMVAAVLCIVFMAVGFIITFNATMMSIYNDKKSFGIYKALGMTPLQIRMSLVWKVVMLSSIGIAAGIPLSLIISPRALGALLANLGMVKFPFDITLAGTLAAIPICLLVAFLSAWIPSGKILSLNPRNLIVE